MTPFVTASPSTLHRARCAVLPLAVLGTALLLTPASKAQNQPGPVVCSTSLEAPPMASSVSGASGGAPVEVTRCMPVQSTAQLVERRFFSWTAPFERGVNLTHQITDLLGIAMGGGDGTKLMGFGFPDQTIVWDGAALNNLYNRLLDAQSPAMPVRSPDLGNPFRSSLVMAPYAPRPLDPQAEPVADRGSSSAATSTVRGLW